MAGSIFVRPKVAPINAGGVPYSGAKYTFYLTSTSTLASVYTDAALTTPHSNPVVADANGVFAPIWLDPAVTYRARLTTSSDVLIEDVDPVSSGFSASQVGAALYPRNAQETAAGVTPSNYAYPAGNVLRYGADPTGAVSSSAAIQATTDSVSSLGGEVYFPPGTYLFDVLVDIPVANTTLRGDGAKLQMGAGTMLDCVASGITFEGLWFASTLTSSTTATGAVRAYDVDRVTFNRCRFSRVLSSFRATATATRTGLNITNCLVDGVYTGSSGTDINNIFDIRGFKDVVFTDNTVTAIDYYRVMKIGTAVIAADPYQPSYLSGRISICNNIWNTGGSGVQQVVDLSFGTQEVVISGNVVETTGTTVPYVFHGKAATSGAGGTTPDNVVITGNSMKLGSGTDCAFYVEGNWGITGFSTDVRAVISDNAVEAAKAVAALFQIKGLNDVVVSGNAITQASVAFGRSIAVTNCKRQIIANNSIGWGSIELNGAGSTQDGVTYTLNPESVVITNNIIDDFNSQGGVNIFNMSALEEISVGRNHIRNQTDGGSIVGAVYFSTVTTTRANISDNFANLAASAKNIVGGTLTATTLIEHDNNWNTVTATWDPASLVDGAGETSAAVTLNRAAFGDTVSVAAPYDLQGITLTGYVSSAGNVRGRLQNETGGTLDLASGTYRFTLRKN